MTPADMSIGALGIGAMPFAQQRTRLDAGLIELGSVKIGFGPIGGAVFPPEQSAGRQSYRIVIERRRCRR